MSCGLGAVILVFMLVKFEQDVSIPEDDLLKADLARLQAAERDMTETIAALRSRNTEADVAIESASRDIERLERTIGETEDQRAQRESELAGIKKDIENAQTAETSDVIENVNRGEETYLIGLRVEGTRIGILVDTSASMTDYRLVDIIRLKGASDAERRQGPKWQRTMATLEWLLARLPGNADVAVIGFNETARPLGNGWTPAADAGGLGAILGEARAMAPGGATNLEAGLQAMNALRPNSVYIITDGLPTGGTSSYKSLNPFARCSALWGGSSTISGECRQRLFEHTISRASLPAGVPVNVILMPLEGDPGAAHLFWLWTSATGGLLISPATGWP